MHYNTVIGISGFARAGKDTLASLLSKKFEDNGYPCKVFSFANALKKDIDQFCIERFGISAFCQDTESKSKIRPMLIAYGTCQRAITNGTYWIERIKPEIDLFLSKNNGVVVIPDLRHKEFDYDEYDFIKSYRHNFIFSVSKILPSGNISPAAHENEERNMPFFLKNADYNLVWSNSSNENYLNSKADECFELVLNKIKK